MRNAKCSKFQWKYIWYDSCVPQEEMKSSEKLDLSTVSYLFFFSWQKEKEKSTLFSSSGELGVPELVKC